MPDSIESSLTIAGESAEGQLPPGRWEELRPRLATLLADFDELKNLESLAMEPMPAFRVAQEEDNGLD